MEYRKGEKHRKTLAEKRRRVALVGRVEVSSSEGLVVLGHVSRPEVRFIFTREQARDFIELMRERDPDLASSVREALMVSIRQSALHSATYALEEC